MDQYSHTDDTDTDANRHAIVLSYTLLIDHLHCEVIRAKPDGSCSRPAETGPSVSGKPARKPAGQKCYRDERDKNNVAHGGRCPWRFV